MKLLTTICIFALSNFTFGQNVNKSKLESLLKQGENTHSEVIIIYKDNKLISEKYFGIGHKDTLIENMSCTKSVVGLAMACLLSDGIVKNLDEPVCNYYPEWKQGQKKFITLRHLVNMTSGIQNVRLAPEEIYPSKNFVQLALCAELSDKPGEVWSYNNKSLNLVAGVIEKISGKRMDLYIKDRLFKPLGIDNYEWSLDEAGNPHMMAGCKVKPSDFVKFGLLTLNKGNFNGKQVILEKYIDEMLMPCKQYNGYGMLWWIDYEFTKFIIDEEIIQKLKTANIDKEFIAKAELCKGTFDYDKYILKIEEVFGKDKFDFINETVKTAGLERIRRTETSGKITYYASGYLGNYIVVDPKNKIVAIRMISEKSFKEDNDGKDNFGEFKGLVYDLCK